MNDVWTPVPPADTPKWRARANEFASRRLEGRVRCPLCSESELRIAFSLDGPRAPRESGGLTFIGSGRYWEWCDGRHHYAYYPDSEVPHWAAAVCVRQASGTRDPSEVVRLLGER
ncbi:hypothetical protein ABTZ03_30120 [Kitasatospora sp. NPDC096077]|uniref:hypothetical protein n=1 Tax=Kitasatospora sp. NPDC096077 TaxID=3155544 RepID=UPI003328B137